MIQLCLPIMFENLYSHSKTIIHTEVKGFKKLLIIVNVELNSHCQIMQGKAWQLEPRRVTLIEIKYATSFACHFELAL